VEIGWYLWGMLPHLLPQRIERRAFLDPRHRHKQIGRRKAVALRLK
jgi:hypothetical protein